MDIYRRAPTGKVAKKSPADRAAYLEAHVDVSPPSVLARAVRSANAFDATVSAVVMGRDSREGPTLPATGAPGRSYRLGTRFCFTSCNPP